MCADACCRQTTALQWALLWQPAVHKAVGSKRYCQVSESSFSKSVCCWKGRKVSVYERVSVLHLKSLKCLLTCLLFFLLIQGCREREGNRQSPKWACLSEKCFWATEEKEQRKEIPRPPVPSPKSQNNPKPQTTTKPVCTALLNA